MASSSSAATNTPSPPPPPPPTPSNHSLSKTLSVDNDALSCLLDQLLLSPAPSLSRPPPPPRLNRHKPTPVPATAPLVSLLRPSRALVVSSLTNFGFFHLADHGIPSHLPSSALLECSSSLLGSPLVAGDLSSLGLDTGDEGDDTFLVFDTSSDKLGSLPETKEYARSLERVGLEVVEMIFPKENPFRKGSVRPRFLMWISEASSSSSSSSNNGECRLKKSYPYVVCLQYEAERKPSWTVGDSGGRIAVEPRVGSVLVSVGDVAKVWSNGRFKKVRGIPDCNPLPPGNCSNSTTTTSQGVSMSILVTLPVETVISPLLSPASDHEDDEEEEEIPTYREFPFEEYAWRVHHDQLLFKDPLLRYKI